MSGSIPDAIASIASLRFVDLSNNQLSGAVPSTIVNLTSLEGLVIQSNNISALPDLSGMPNLFDLWVGANRLTFEDIEPNVSDLYDAIRYSPQANVGTADTIYLNAGDQLNLSFQVGGSANIYQWQLNGQDVNGETLDTLARIVTAADYGVWTLVTANTISTGLQIYSAPITVIVRAEGMFAWATAGDLTNDGANSSLYGGAWGDYDQDGFEDIFTVGISDTVRGHLYHNDGTGTFTRIPDSGFDFADGRGGAWGDYNNDGYPDLFVPDASFAIDSTDGKAAIYKNNGNGTFTEISLNETAISGSWVDLDFDGDLDLSLEGTLNSKTIILRNDKNDIFTKVDVGIEFGTQWSSVWIDFNNDSRPDYFIPSTYGNANSAKLLSMEDGYRFYEQGGINQTFTGQPLGGSWADIDNDGDQDLYMVLNQNDESRFFINDGSGYFAEVFASAVLGEVVKGNRASAFGDLNNDGYVDLLTTNQSPAGGLITAYLNNGDGTFARLMNQTFKPSDSRIGISVADYNNDGALDFFTGSFSAETNRLYQNLLTTNHWVKIKLQGTSSNRNAIGARLAVFAGGFARHHQVMVTNGFGNQNSVVSHFGLGNFTTVDSIQIVWPSGRTQWVANLPADQVHVIAEPANTPFTGDVTVTAVKQIAGVTSESEVEISTYTDLDDLNNTYMSASFFGTIDVDPGPGTSILSGGQSGGFGNNAFIAKYGPAGDLIWVKQIAAGSSGNGLYVTALSVATDQSIVVAGEFEGSIDVDPSDGVFMLTVSNPNTYNEGFLAKYDNNGNFVWAKQFVSTGESVSNWITDMDTDTQNNIIVQVEFYGYSGGETVDADLGPEQHILTNGGGSDMFFAKYTPDAALSWVVPFTTVAEEDGGGIVLDEIGNIYANYTTRPSDTSSTQNLKVIKLKPDGAVTWEATSSGVDNEHETQGLSIADDGALLMTGSFIGSTTLQGTSGSVGLAGNPQGENAFLARFTADGVLEWAKAFTATGGAEIYAVSSIPNNGGILISGSYEGSMDMDPGAEVYEQFYPAESACYIRLTQTGDFVWGFSVRNGFGIHRFNTQGEMIATMNFWGTTDVDPTSAVSSLTAIGETNIAWVKYDVGVLVGISPSDSLLLKQFYDATGGPSWTNKTNWLNGNISSWHGITVTNNKIVAINLPNNNLTGAVPNDFSGLNELTTIDWSGNKITSIPDLSVLPSLTTLNVAGNRLDFSSLEPLKNKIATLSYQNQAVIGVIDTTLVETGTPHLISLATGGTANQYQWFRNGTAIQNATTPAYEIPAVTRTSMGEYVLKVTNTIVDDLTLTFASKYVLAVAELTGRLYASANTPAVKGRMRLLRVTNSNGYDTIKSIDINTDGTYRFSQVILDNYQLLGFADTLEHDRALPTYYKNTLYWEEADTLYLEGSLDSLDIVSQLKPLSAPTGNGVIDGFVVEEVTDPGGRPYAPKRVGNAGVSVRKVETTGRGKEEVLTLVAYVFTDENGEFEFTHLPVADYRINIQYPGYPMDETSFVTIPIGTALESQKRVEATVDEGKITVRELVITGVWEMEGYHVVVYPNPSSDFIKVEFESPGARGLQLLDVTGRNMSAYQTSQKTTEIDVRRMQRGIYLLNITEKGQIVKTVRVEVK
ncbi:MAG TPA: FG-GAP-like repeat-containing protein [Chryseosolibacter sp.]|nr:FG-GAP-like repeat-containing protein [Chryseosolibacter sp.]